MPVAATIRDQAVISRLFSMEYRLIIKDSLRRSLEYQGNELYE